MVEGETLDDSKSLDDCNVENQSMLNFVFLHG